MSRSIAILDRLVAFPTVSRDSNLALIDYVDALLGETGASIRRVPDPTGTKAGLFARIGPERDGGTLLSAHTDVVPTEGQRWTSDPFRMRPDGTRLYGRGTTDMKGFVACMLAAAERAATRALARPLLLALSWDEELGCLGIPHMLPHLEPAIGRPALCVVGEPTRMAIALGHKGKQFLRATCCGQAGHSAMAPDFVNALHLATDFTNEIRSLQDDVAAHGFRDPDYAIPYATLHVARIQGGVALNIVPDSAVIDFEIRSPAGEDVTALRTAIDAAAERVAARYRDRFPGAEIAIEEVNAYPGLGTPPDAEAVRTLQSLLPGATTTKVAYGTEAGYFDKAGIPTLVCGPGDMAQGHQPDEFIETSELAACDAFCDRLIGALESSD